jgi:hypothetical protein
MALDSANRANVLAQIIRDAGWPGLTKPDVLAAVAAVDDWAEANAAAYNSALPVPFRTTATAPQKALLLAYVCMRRAGILKVEGE